MITGPVRVEVYDLQGKLLFSGMAESASISPNRGVCLVLPVSNALASKV